MDENLSWQHHVSHLNSKLHRGIGIISKIRYYLPKHLLRTIYFAFFHPHLDYSILNWGCASHTTLLPIEISLNKIIRIMSFADSDATAHPLFQNFKLLNFKKHVLLSQSKFMWQINNNFVPSCIQNIFKKTT